MHSQMSTSKGATIVDQCKWPCCQEFHTTEEKQKHVLEQHLGKILDEQIRPAYQKHKHPALNKPLPGARFTDNSMDLEFHENQKWKEKNSLGYAAVDVLEWVVELALVSFCQPFSEFRCWSDMPPACSIRSNVSHDSPCLTHNSR